MKLIVTQTFRPILFVLLAFAIVGCGAGDAESGAGEQTSNQSASGPIAESTADSANTAVAGRGSDRFSLVFEMSHQSCASCGIWFDSAELVIVHSGGRFSARQVGSLLIKKAPYHQGRFDADISSIPSSASIQSATLYMHLNTHEGIANSDTTSSISVYGDIDGSRTYIREITARDDIKGKGHSKANPIVPIDFTGYSQRI